jgi:hypothetical protein
MMTKIATDKSDVTILTSDNPKNEDPCMYSEYFQGMYANTSLEQDFFFTGLFKMLIFSKRCSRFLVFLIENCYIFEKGLAVALCVCGHPSS